MTSRICWLFLLLMLFTVPAHADPVTVIFNSVGSSQPVPSYTEQGFNFTGGMLIRGFSLPGSPMNHIIENNSSHITAPHPIRIEFAGGTFDFLGADQLFSIGGNVFRASNGAELSFGSSSGFVDAQGLFTNITWLEWVHFGHMGERGPAPAGMDNFRFETHPGTVPTPEPATLLLLGSGLLGALKVARRKREV